MARALRNTCKFAVIIAVMMLIISYFGSCKQSTQVSESLYDYYINEQTFAGKGIVYTYEPTSNPALPVEHWHYRFLHDWRGNTFKSALYDQARFITQESVERLTDNHSQLMSLELMYQTEEGVVSLTPQINQRGTYPFGPIDPGVRAIYQIEYYDTSEDSVRVILTKERTLAEQLEYPMDGKMLPAVRFTVLETLETETQGFTETSWSGTEIYVQDIGLVYFKKTISDQMTLEYSLVHRRSFEEFLSE